MDHPRRAWLSTIHAFSPFNPQTLEHVLEERMWTPQGIKAKTCLSRYQFDPRCYRRSTFIWIERITLWYVGYSTTDLQNQVDVQRISPDLPRIRTRNVSNAPKHQRQFGCQGRQRHLQDIWPYISDTMVSAAIHGVSNMELLQLGWN